MSWTENTGSDHFEGLDLRKLKVDEAYVRVTTSFNKLWLYKLSDICYKCPFLRSHDLSSVPPDHVLTHNTKHGETWRLYPAGEYETLPVGNTSELLCEVSAHLGEFGVYDLTVDDVDNQVTCTLKVAKDPVNIYLPLLIYFFIFLAVILIWIGVRVTNDQLKKREKKRYIIPTSQMHSMDPPTPEPEQPSPQLTARRRLKSLDTFRGISIVLMVFVNFGAGHYWFFEHATWNGLQVADLLFPWFMWIMGACIPISIRSQLKKNVSRFQIFVAVLRRSCILFALGLMLNTVGVGGNLERIRIFGVLQRFGVCYFVVATLGLLLTCRDYKTPKFSFFAGLHDIIVLLPQWLVIGGIIAGHTVLILMMEVPHCPKGYLGPGGIQDDSSFKECVGGATGYLDRLILGRSHLYQWPTAEEVYKAGPFDPEGLIGCLTSVVQVFLGVQAGAILLFHETVIGRVTRWMAWGTITGVAGGVLCLASKEDGWIPVNKNLWSLSFVLVTSCFAYILLAVLYLLIDVKKYWSGAPFFYPGMNSTIIYVGHSVTYNLFPWHWALGPMNTHFILMLEAVWGTALWVLVGYWLYRVKFFLTI